MKTTALTIMAVFAASTRGLHAAPARIEMDFATLLPEKWKVAQFESDVTAPYSWEHDPTNVGVSIRFEGPTRTNFRGTDTAEAVTIWIMPKDYVGKRLDGAQFPPAQFFGQRGNHKLYAHSVPQAATWPSWREDLKTKLKITEPNKNVDGAKQ